MELRGYETLYILKAGLADDKYKELVEKFNGWVVKNEGEIVESKIIGNRDLPSTFQRHEQGYFVLCQFKGSRNTVGALDAQMRVSEPFVRSLTVLMASIYDQRKKAPAKVAVEA